MKKERLYTTENEKAHIKEVLAKKKTTEEKRTFLNNYKKTISTRVWDERVNPDEVAAEVQRLIYKVGEEKGQAVLPSSPVEYPVVPDRTYTCTGCGHRNERVYWFAEGSNVPRPCQTCYERKKRAFFDLQEKLTISEREEGWEKLDLLAKTPAVLEVSDSK
jgi:hypothetical protein